MNGSHVCQFYFRNEFITGLFFIPQFVDVVPLADGIDSPNILLPPLSTQKHLIKKAIRPVSIFTHMRYVKLKSDFSYISPGIHLVALK